MTQYVLLSADQTTVVTLFHGAQPAQANYAEIADDDARILAYEAAAQAQSAFAAKLAAGLPIVSTATPALSGTYAISAASQQTISGIYAGIKGGDGVPGGGSTFNYPDASGATHSFSATNFTNFAKAVRDYVYALSQGGSPSLPVTVA